MTVDYLITGVTGGLGAAVLARLLKLVPASSIAVSSSKPSRAAEFEALGVHFRVADYRDPGTLDNAFKDVRKLFFTSSDSFDHAQRTRDHGNVVKAAKRAGVGHVYYSSLALGGYEESKIELQIAHANTEKMLEKCVPANFLFAHRDFLHFSPSHLRHVMLVCGCCERADPE